MSQNMLRYRKNATEINLKKISNFDSNIIAFI